MANTWLRRSAVREEEANRQNATEVIDILNLSQLINERAGNLSGGQKKLLERAAP